MPLAFDGTLLVVVVTLLEMSLSVSLPAGHCANREHSPTLALFEVQDQQIKYEGTHGWHSDECRLFAKSSSLTYRQKVGRLFMSANLEGQLIEHAKASY